MDYIPFSLLRASLREEYGHYGEAAVLANRAGAEVQPAQEESRERPPGPWDDFPPKT